MRTQTKFIISLSALVLIVLLLAILKPELFDGLRRFPTYTRAAQRFNEEKFSAALSDFEKLLGSSEESMKPKILYMIARCYREQEPPQLDKAIEYYALVYKRYPNNSLADDAMAMHASCEYRRDNFAIAMKLYRQLMENPIGNGDKSGVWRYLKEATINHILKKRGLIGGTRQNIRNHFLAEPLSLEEKKLIGGILNKERNLDTIYVFNFYEDYLREHTEDYVVSLEYYRTLMEEGQEAKAYGVKRRLKGEYLMQAEIVEIRRDYESGYYTRVIEKIDRWLVEFRTFSYWTTADMYYLRGNCLIHLDKTREVVSNLVEIAKDPYLEYYPTRKLFRETTLYLIENASSSEILRIENELRLSGHVEKMSSLVRAWHYWQQFDYESLAELLREVMDGDEFHTDYNRYERSNLALEADIIGLLASKASLSGNNEAIKELIEVETLALRNYILEIAQRKAQIDAKVSRVDDIPDVEGVTNTATQLLAEYANRGDIQLIEHIIEDPDFSSVVDYLREVYVDNVFLRTTPIRNLFYKMQIESVYLQFYDLFVDTLEYRWQKNDYYELKNKAKLSFLKVLFLTYLKHESLMDLAEAFFLYHCKLLGQTMFSPFSYEFNIEALPLNIRRSNLSRAESLFSTYLLDDQTNTVNSTVDKDYVESLVRDYLDHMPDFTLDL